MSLLQAYFLLFLLPSPRGDKVNYQNPWDLSSSYAGRLIGLALRYQNDWNFPTLKQKWLVWVLKGILHFLLCRVLSLISSNTSFTKAALWIQACQICIAPLFRLLPSLTERIEGVLFLESDVLGNESKLQVSWWFWFAAQPNFHLCPFNFISEVAPWSFNKYQSFCLAVNGINTCPQRRWWQKSLWFMRAQFNKNVFCRQYQEFCSKIETEQAYHFSFLMWEFWQALSFPFEGLPKMKNS